MKKMKYFTIFLSLVFVACSSADISKQKNEDTKKELKTVSSFPPHSMINNESILDKEVIRDSSTAPPINIENDINSQKQNPPTISLPSEEEKESEAHSVPQESSQPVEQEVQNLEGEQSEDFIIIGESKYINIMHEEKFKHWITVAEKYGTKLYAIPFSDVFAIVKEGDVLVGMSTGVANAKPENIDILCDVFSDEGEYAVRIIDGIKQVAQTGEGVHLEGADEYNVISIFKQDERIIVSW